MWCGDQKGIEVSQETFFEIIDLMESLNYWTYDLPIDMEEVIDYPLSEANVVITGERTEEGILLRFSSTNTTRYIQLNCSHVNSILADKSKFVNMCNFNF